MVNMAGSDENHPGVITRPSNIQGESGPGGGKLLAEPAIVQNRRALSTIDRNIIGGPTSNSMVIKRSSSTDQNAVANRVPPVPIHRPITRLLTAQIQQQQPVVQESKPPVIPEPSSAYESEDCTIIDVDDYPVPMSVQHTEAMLDEIDRMDAEFEMEVEDAEFEDIDSPDKKNPLAVTEYVNDIFSYYRKVETSSKLYIAGYMFCQDDINERMRTILIDWLIEVHYKFDLMEETLYLTVNLIDRYLARASVVRKKLQLVGVTAMLLACKYEEVSVPMVDDFVVISDRAYCREDILEMESVMVNTLQFNLSVPTPYVFMKRFLKAAQSDTKLELLSFFITELCLVEYEMLNFPPSLLAAAAIFTAQCSLSGCKDWNKTCEKYTNYTQEQLMECSKMMVTFHQKSGTGKHTAVHRKYSTKKYGFTAKSSQPALFLLDAAFMKRRYCMI